MPEPGTILSGRYRIDAKIGEGGMGEVYKAFDIELEKTIALKTLLPQLKDDPEAQRDLRREVVLSQELSHPNIVRVHHLETRSEVPYMTMEYVDGITLAMYKGQKGKLDLDELLSIAKPIMAALAYAHSCGVVHRDIKPQNIMLTKGGGVRVMDFGIAQALQDAYTKVTGQAISGTLYYMAPEHIRGQPADVRSDIYSLASMLYELAAGKPPFWTGDIVYQHLHEPPQLIHGIPDELNRALFRGLEKDPDQRYQQVSEFADALLGKGVVTAVKTAVRAMPTTPSYNLAQTLAPPKQPPGMGAAMKAFWAFSGLLVVLIVITLVVLLTNPFGVGRRPSTGRGGGFGSDRNEREEEAREERYAEAEPEQVEEYAPPPEPEVPLMDVVVPDRDEPPIRPLASARQIGVGQSVSGEANGRNEIYYRFRADAGGQFRIFTASEIDTVGELLDNSGNSLARDDDGGEDANFRIGRRLAPGTYYVTVRGYGTATSGEYTLHVVNLDGVASLAIDRSVYGDCQGRVFRYFRFRTDRSGTYRIYSSSSIDTVGELLDVDLRQLDYDDDDGDGRNFMIERSLSQGTYYVRVRGFSTSTTGSYTLHLTSGGAGTGCGNPTDLRVGQGISGSVDGQTWRYYRFRINSSGQYSIYTSSSIDTVGELLNSNCSSIESNDDGGQGTNFLIQTNLGSGTYYVRIRGYSASTSGSFNLYVVPGATGEGTDCDGAGNISVGASVSVSLSGRTWRYYRFTVSSRGNYRIYTSGSIDSYGELLDSGCRSIVSNDDGGESLNFQIDRTLNAGTYYIRVRGYSDTITGTTTLRLIRQ